MCDEEVVIIGAGISGLATALALHKKGIKSVVMERSETLRNDGSAIGIRPNGWRALNQLGVADILRRTSIPLQRERVVSLDGGKQQDILLHLTWQVTWHLTWQVMWHPTWQVTWHLTWQMTWHEYMCK
ncbi:putative 3-hydroxybenzoate 6-monooxygenase [Helianthus annuus]|nr:putative 3-hydroxybenzoate 6-monooxygenase [Helianthus annuus]